MDLEKLVIPRDYVESITENISHNKITLDYYQLLAKDSEFNFEFATEHELVKKQIKNKTIENKIDRIANCNRYWTLDKWDIQKIKAFKKTNLCRDKFCNNCKKVKQASRMAKYIPELEPYRQNIYHMVLTAPNVPGIDLKASINRQNKAFRMIIRYLAGDLKIKGLDFIKYGYRGAVRSNEVTYRGDSYHPHMHIAIILENGPTCEQKTITNRYSFHYNELRRLFSEFEILIQKIFYLLYNGIRVTKKEIDSLSEGFSCIVDYFSDSDYAELFKYMTKSTDQDGTVMSYGNFKVLEDGLHSLRQIQGYGCLYNVKDDGIDEEEIVEIWSDIVNYLNKIENPVEVRETPQDLSKDNVYTLISPKRIYTYLRQL